jgi:peptidoglycan/LPS O-acetylase OafA/YrhL
VKRRLGHRPPLDGVRALAIAGVVGLHTSDRLAPGGFFGVDVFFALSAFLITALVIEELEGSCGRFDYRSFYWRRVFRLAPALLLWLGLIAAPTAIALGDAALIPVATVTSLAYSANATLAAGAELGPYTHVWSLGVEEQFYLLWPAALVALVATRRYVAHRVLVVAALPAAVVVAKVANDFVGPGENYFLPSGHLVPLTAGCIAGTLFVRRSSGTIERLFQRHFWGVAALVLLGTIVVGYPGVSANAGLALQAAVAVSTVMLILHVCVCDHGRVAQLLSLRPLLWIGRRSYGLYLYHGTIVVLVPALLPGIQLRYAAPLALASSILMADLSFRFVECPLNVRGRAWLRSRQDRAEGAPEVVVASAT